MLKELLILPSQKRVLLHRRLPVLLMLWRVQVRSARKHRQSGAAGLVDDVVGAQPYCLFEWGKGLVISYSPSPLYPSPHPKQLDMFRPLPGPTDGP